MSLKIKIPLLLSIFMVFNIILMWIGQNIFLPINIVDRISMMTGVQITREKLMNSRLLQSYIVIELVILIMGVLGVGIIGYISLVRPIVRLNTAIKGNITHRPLKEISRKDELGELYNSYVRMEKQLLEEKNIRNRMMASIAHDIKTPLTSVLGYSETLLKKELPKERQRKYLSIICDSARDVEEIIGEFESYVEGQVRNNLQIKEYKLVYIERMLIEEYQEELSGLNIRFQVINDCKDNAVCQCDLMKIRRIFANIIGNSIKHNKGRENISIIIRIQEMGKEISFCIIDNGYGVRKEDAEHIFEPFFTSDASRSVSGLGLSICKELLEMQGGRIRLNRDTKDGFSIEVFLLSRL